MENNLNSIEKYLYLKAINNITSDKLNEYKNIILNKLQNNEIDKTQSFGNFSIRTTNAKSVNELIAKKEKDIAKLQNELDELKQYKRNIKVTNPTYTLITSVNSDITENVKHTLLNNLLNIEL